MALNPVDMLRRWRKFRALVREEVGFLVERHGAAAREASLEELKKPNLSPQRVRLLQAAYRELKGDQT